MSTPPRDCVTNTEFSRWVAEETAYRSRVAQQLETHHAYISNELHEIKAMVKEANGRTNANGQAIALMQRELEAIKAEDSSIEHVVEEIQKHGCAQLANHEAVMTTLGWSPQKKALVASGLIGSGAVIWPVLQEIAEVVHALVERTP